MFQHFLWRWQRYRSTALIPATAAIVASLRIAWGDSGRMGGGLGTERRGLLLLLGGELIQHHLSLGFVLSHNGSNTRRPASQELLLVLAHLQQLPLYVFPPCHYLLEGTFVPRTEDHSCIDDNVLDHLARSRVPHFCYQSPIDAQLCWRGM